MIKRPRFLSVPCGKILGMGEYCCEYCCEGRLCSQCEYILELENIISEFEKEKRMHQPKTRDEDLKAMGIVGEPE